MPRSLKNQGFCHSSIAPEVTDIHLKELCERILDNIFSGENKNFDNIVHLSKFLRGTEEVVFLSHKQIVADLIEGFSFSEEDLLFASQSLSKAMVLIALVRLKCEHTETFWGMIPGRSHFSILFQYGTMCSKCGLVIRLDKRLN